MVSCTKLHGTTAATARRGHDGHNTVRSRARVSVAAVIRRAARHSRGPQASAACSQACSAAFPPSVGACGGADQGEHASEANHPRWLRLFPPLPCMTLARLPSRRYMMLSFACSNKAHRARPPSNQTANMDGIPSPARPAHSPPHMSSPHRRTAVRRYEKDTGTTWSQRPAMGSFEELALQRHAADAVRPRRCCHPALRVRRIINDFVERDR